MIYKGESSFIVGHSRLTSPSLPGLDLEWGRDECYDDTTVGGLSSIVSSSCESGELR